MESISVPQGGGAIQGIDEAPSSNPATGASQSRFPLPGAKGRSNFGPALSLAYDSGRPNGPFGLGFSVDVPQISRRTDKGVPRYDDCDRFLFNQAEELVTQLSEQNGTLASVTAQRTVDGATYSVAQYRPRVEGAPMRIERWTNLSGGADHWRSISIDNVTTRYGFDASSRIADPADPTRVLTWLADQVSDATGNMLLYSYKAEDGAGVDPGLSYETNRAGQSAYAQRYLKRVYYGNATPSNAGSWFFELLFDYGEHDATTPTDAEVRPWPVRADAFSSYRSGFEVRTYRLCQRVLAFNTFAQLGTEPVLTQSLNLTYDGDTSQAKLVSLQSFGYIQSGTTYTNASLPPVALTYAPRTIVDQVTAVDAESGQNLLPIGNQSMWIDLYREGLAGILTATASDWHYKRNLGNGTFAPLVCVHSFPGLAEVPNFKDIRFADIDGDGGLELVRFDKGKAGFQRLRSDGWEAFTPFESWPTVSPKDPNLRMLDVDGDGRADLLLAGDDRFEWYRGIGDRGFAPADSTMRVRDEELGPAVVFAEEAQTVFFADMSGDGLTDIVRIRNGEIVYWPNLGYGRFGPKVAMQNAPLFDDPDSYDPGRVRLADIDGNGCADLVYLSRDGAYLYFNLAGNAWSTSAQLSAFPPIDDVSSVSVLDMLGTGTASIVWSTPLPADPGSQLCYIDLLGSQKPHLLTTIANNLGRVVNLTYAPSTQFYLADEAAGMPWVSKIPFVVHVVSKIDSFDNITQRRYATTSSYHHGFYDFIEREFAGFGRIDQYDTETVEAFALSGASNVVEEDVTQPPILTRTWRHPGSAPSAVDPLALFAKEYFAGGAIGAPRASPGPDPSLTVWEWIQHFRALRGAILRQEVYANDNTPSALIPYTVSENTYCVQMRQATGPNRFAVFSAYGYETIGYQCERVTSDPRINHLLTLGINDVGQITSQANVTYPRRITDTTLPADAQSAQSALYISYAESDYTNDVDTDDAYRLRTCSEARGWDILGVTPAAAFFDPAELTAKIAAAAAIDFSAAVGSGPERRLVSRKRTYSLADDLSGPLPLGTQGALGLLSNGVSLSFTSALVSSVYGTLATDAIMESAGYVHSEGDSDWWAPTGSPVYAANAAQHFYRATGFTDPFGNVVSVAFDGYDLLPLSVTDPLGNVTSCVNDYRTLKPSVVTDVNGNQTAVAVDELGFVTAIAQMGKPGSTGNDTLASPTQRFEYDASRWMNSQLPAVTRAYARERRGDASTPWQTSYAYSDGGGKIIMTKLQAEPGIASELQSDGTVTQVDTTPALRYVGNGRTVVNNKGNPIRQYEPYFSVTYEFESASALVEIGYSPTFYYDPLGRLIRVEFPDGTHALSTFGAWSQQSYDPDDAVLTSTWYAALGSPNPSGPQPADPNVRAAWLAAQCANTPGVSYLDSLGRVVYAIADNGVYGKYGAFVGMDGPGTYSTLIDPLGRTASTSRVNVSRQTIQSTTLDRPTRLVLPDVQGKTAYVWDGTERVFHYAYDAARRPTALYQQSGSGVIAISVTLYGDLRSDGATVNLRNRVAAVCDQAGLITIAGYDLCGNALGMTRTFGANYTSAIDWSPCASVTTLNAALTAAKALLETESFTNTMAWDALSRVTTMTLPDGTVYTPSYDAGNHLDTLDVSIRGAAAMQFVQSETHDARGRRLTTSYGNGTVALAQYDEVMGRLVGLRLTRTSDSVRLMDRSYVYDPVGNIVSSADAAQQTAYFKNAVVAPAWSYVYDPIYQLRSATGREHAGGIADVQRDWTDLPTDTIPNVNDAAAVRTYTQTYAYDPIGNITTFAHAATGASWTRYYSYDTASNRLNATSLPGDPAAGPYSAKYTYDAFGNTISMPNLATMQWNAYDQLQQVDLGGGGTGYYVYDGNGQRVRKVIVSGGLTKDSKHLGLLEIYREITGGTINLERQTVHVTESGHRIAQIDTTTIDTSDDSQAGAQAIRYQNQELVGSSVLTCDESGNVVTYEEYHPFGTTSYRSSLNAAETSLKRYRFLDREHDDETGMYCCGVRYYMPWLGRWCSPDPGGFMGSFNLYAYAHNQPVSFGDPNGYQPKTGVRQVTWFKSLGSESVNSLQRFENWAKANGIRYTGTPTYDPQKHIWSVDTWQKVKRGTGGPATAPAAAAPPPPPAQPPPTAQTSAPDPAASSTTGAGTSPAGGTGGTAPSQNLNIGNIARYKDQPAAEFAPDGSRLTENEHIVQAQPLRDMSTNGAADPLYDGPSYDNSTTLRLDRATSVAKTRLDMQYLRNMRNGTASSSLGDVGEAYRQNTLQAIEETRDVSSTVVSEETVNTAYLSQMGDIFGTTPLGEVLDNLPAPPPAASSVFGSMRSFAGAAGTFTLGMGGALVRTLIPGFAEAEVAVSYYGTMMAATYGTETALGTLGAAMAAAPAAVVGTVLASGAAGYFVGGAVGHLVENATGSKAAGVASGVLAGAGTGALVGAAIGSIVPGLGTAVGAGIGAAVGAIGGFIGSFW